jgi:hypothetical protein
MLWLMYWLNYLGKILSKLLPYYEAIILGPHV